jgi:hypothetical protein
MAYSKRISEIEKLYSSLGLDKDRVWHKTKALLNIYRKVVWSLHDSVDYMVADNIETYGKSLDKALSFLYDFAPIEQKKDFEDKVTYLFETKWLIDLIDKSLVRIKEYPEQGELYYNIIHNIYLKEKKIFDVDCMALVSMEKTMYYQRKKEAIYLMGIALWGYAIPDLRQEMNFATTELKISQ